MVSHLTSPQFLFIARQHFAAGRWTAAEDLARRVLAQHPRDTAALHLLGQIAAQTNRPQTALTLLEQAAEITPDHLELQRDLAEVYRTLQRPAEIPVGAGTAEGAGGKTGGAVPAQTAAACFKLGRLHHDARDLDEASACYRRALELDPNFVLPLNNLAMARKDQGLAQEAIELLRTAVQMDPHLPQMHSNLVYLLHLPAQADGPTILREHRAWNTQHAAALLPPHPVYEVAKTTNRRLRVGYVSPDFYEHPVGRFLLALFAAHDHSAFEIVCYSSVPQEDPITVQLRAGADQWIHATELSDEALAARIRQDRIDILVDLTMHLARHRLLTFARKPAPVQITYLAYCSTTGLDAMDYRLTDPYLDPRDADSTERDRERYSERSIHLPETYWCYQPPEAAPAINPLPALTRGHVTLASLNNFCKVTPQTLQLWTRLLQQLPTAHLLIHAYPGSQRQRVRDLFAAAGIAPERLGFFDRLTLPHYLRLHHAIDLGLDPYPHGGGTTTCDALWMGVPTVSLVGPAALSRGGLSILSNVGLPELAAHSPEDYLRIASELASDLPRLAALRTGMRDRLLASPLTNGPRFAKNLEGIYRSLWQNWCQTVRP